MPVDVVPATLRGAVLGVLCRYFEALENGQAQYLYPDPGYAWRWYQGNAATLEGMRTKLTDLDGYLNAGPQHDWAQRNAGRERGVAFEGGPDLSRLPDHAVVAMFQELDSIYDDHLRRGGA